MNRALLFKTIGRAALVAYYFFAGFFGISFLVSDLGLNETSLERAAVTGAYFFVAGAVAGLAERHRPWRAGFIGWGAVLLFIVTFFTDVTQGFGQTVSSALLLLPVAIAVGGGYAGNGIRRVYEKKRTP